jgi:uncharacterized membrane protein YesL
MFNLFNIPAVLIGLLASMVIFPQFMPGLDMTNAGDVMGDLISRFVVLTIFLCIPVITVGPAQAGFTYILRNYSREEHAFIWSDFKEHALKNFKQSMMVSFLDFLFILLLGNALMYYYQYARGGFLALTGRIFILLGLIIFLMMHIYIYPMMVTFKLNIRQLYKNAVIFTIIKFLPNLLILFICFAFIFLSFSFAQLGMTLLILITFSTTGLLTNFYAYPVIKKYMIDPIDGKTDTDDGSTSSDSENNTSIENKDKKAIADDNGK